MKLVVAPLWALDRYVSREFALVIRELVDSHGWATIDPGLLWDDARPWREILLRAFDRLPEAILFWEGYALINRYARQVAALGCKTAVFADDLHWHDAAVRWSKLLAFLVCDMVVSTYAPRFESFFPEVYRIKRVVWCPHAASGDFLLPFNDEAENAVFVSGAMSLVYPLRRALVGLSESGAYPIVRHRHPGYHCGFDHARDPSVGPGYARLIRRYRASFTDGSRHRYTVAKFFEIPATGALLLGDGAVGDALHRLGFVPDEHYVPVTADDLEDRVRDVLDPSNHARLDVIRRNGQALVRGRHTTGDRARLIDGVASPGG